MLLLGSAADMAARAKRKEERGKRKEERGKRNPESDKDVPVRIGVRCRDLRPETPVGFAMGAWFFSLAGGFRKWA